MNMIISNKYKQPLGLVVPSLRDSYKIVFWGIIGIAGILYMLLLTPVAGYLRDDAIYMTLAKSIAHNNGYRIISSPQNNLYSKQPFIFPLLLSPAFIFTSNINTNIIICEIISILFMLAFLVVLYFYLRVRLSNVSQPALIALFILFLTAFHHRTLSYFSSGPVMSEGCYALFVVITLLLFERRRNIFLIVLFAIIIFYTRIVGVALGISLLLYLLLKKRYREMLLYSGIYVIFALVWYYRSWRLGLPGGYFDELLLKNVFTLEKINGWHDILLRFFSNLWTYMNYGIPDIIFPISVGKRPMILAHRLGIFTFILICRVILFDGIMLIGFISKLKEKVTPLELYVVIYVIIYLFWPYVQVRFLWPLLPFVFFYFIIGIKTILKPIKTRLIRKHYKTLAFSGLFIFLLGFSPRHKEFLHIIKTPYTERKDDEMIKEHENAFLWLRNNTKKEDILITEDASLFYLYTQRKATGLNCFEDAEETMKDINKYRGNYLIVTSMIPLYMQPIYNLLLVYYPQNFREVYVYKEISIYRIVQ